MLLRVKFDPFLVRVKGENNIKKRRTVESGNVRTAVCRTWTIDSGEDWRCEQTRKSEVAALEFLNEKYDDGVLVLMSVSPPLTTVVVDRARLLRLPFAPTAYHFLSAAAAFSDTSRYRYRFYHIHRHIHRWPLSRQSAYPAPANNY